MVGIFCCFNCFGYWRSQQYRRPQNGVLDEVGPSGDLSSSRRTSSIAKRCWSLRAGYLSSGFKSIRLFKWRGISALATSLRFGYSWVSTVWRVQFHQLVQVDRLPYSWVRWKAQRLMSSCITLGRLAQSSALCFWLKDLALRRAYLWVIRRFTGDVICSRISRSTLSRTDHLGYRSWTGHIIYGH